MAKAFLASSDQAQIIINKIDAMDAKIVTPRYQAKIVEPTTSQQLITPDSGYDALSSVTVNASTVGRTLENYVMRNNQEDLFDLNLNGNVPNYACYSQTHLRKVTGNITNVGICTFQNCSSLQEIDCRNVATINQNSFSNCHGLGTLDLRNIPSVSVLALTNCYSLLYLDIRNCMSFEVQALANDASLRLVDLTLCESPPIITNNALIGISSTCMFVFKDATVQAAVQSATDWSARASQIKTIAEIEALYGDTYDNLYLQWFGHARNDASEVNSGD